MLRSLLKSARKAVAGLTSADLSRPPDVPLFVFDSPKVLQRWHVFTDAFFGGKSSAALTYNAAERAAEFTGRVTLEQAEDADMRRSGYCVAASKVEAIGDYSDLSGCSHLVLHVKGDGRTYIANVRVDSIAGTGGDIWQAPFRTRPGEWAQVSIPIAALALTYQGQLVERQLEFQADKVIGVGVAASAMPCTEAAGSSEAGSSEAGSREAGSSEAGSSEAGSASIGGAQAAQQAAEGSLSAVADARGAPPHERFRLLIRDIRAEAHGT